MQITDAMMGGQLRATGVWLRRIGSRHSERRLRVAGALVDGLLWLARARRPKTLRVEEFGIDRGDGTRLRVVVYSPPAQTTAAAGLLWLHGGGYFLGRPEQDMRIYGDWPSGPDVWSSRPTTGSASPARIPRPSTTATPP
ncbi:hypothetical protein [Nocardia sp. NPDC059228]|uniref:hypothetical protein n=1 Tax=Nocardia sp. NPDC059228 TaxID=3346777 RepID=UPI0036805532